MIFYLKSSSLFTLTIKKNIKNQKFISNQFKDRELDVLVLKSITNNILLPINIRDKACKDLHILNKKGKVRKVCIYTGRSRGVVS